jgi:lycopene cyclase domain-containing protein
MTYFGFLLRFVFLPILILLVYAWWDGSRTPGGLKFRQEMVWRVILVHVALALVYTTPWDNYLVATGVWSYNPRLVSGVILGWVPLEEYTFFVVETLLSGLWWWFLARRLPEPGEFKPSRRGRLLACSALLAAWLFFAWLFFSGWKPGTYLSITLFWALPAIFPQFLFGADLLWHYRRLVLWAILPVGLYLSLTDMIALKAGTWAISPSQTTGVLFFGVLPLEEVLFFFITNVLIAFGLTLMLTGFAHQRYVEWRARGYKGLP